MKKVLIVFEMLLLLLVFVVLQYAQIPRTLSYQGIITDNAGKPRPDQDYPFTFCLYDTAIGGSPLWTEQKTLPVKGGLFSTVLGDQKPFGAAVKFDKQYWLGIQVGSEAELAPRIRLTSVGYSFSAIKSDTAAFARSGGSDNWATNGNDVYQLQGSVGIGIIPTSPLHIKRIGWVGIALDNEDTKKSKQLDFKTKDVLRWWIGVSGEETGKDAGSNFYINRRHDDGTSIETPFCINRANGYVGIGTTSPTCKLHVVGRTKTQVLEITGGFDLAEPFEISHADSLPVGSLVVIDPEQPGKLKQATEPYDKRVAGVISGAGGINPGLTLNQEGKLAGSQHVALTGKVYALATAANGAIEPGDLLTTSSIPGHAMKAIDKELWPGAVIGKAMSGLKEGEGLVLVLVNLQ